MLVKPLNRHLLVAPQTAEERSSAVLLPEDFKEEKERYSVVRVLAIAGDCKPPLQELMASTWLPSKNILVQTDMVDAVDVRGEVFHFVLENYVLGIVKS